MSNSISYIDLKNIAETIAMFFSFVAEQNMEVIREKKLKAIEEQLGNVIRNSKEIGLSYDELQDILKILYEE